MTLNKKISNLAVSLFFVFNSNYLIAMDHSDYDSNAKTSFSRTYNKSHDSLRGSHTASRSHHSHQHGKHHIHHQDDRNQHHQGTKHHRGHQHHQLNRNQHHQHQKHHHHKQRSFKDQFQASGFNNVQSNESKSSREFYINRLRENKNQTFATNNRINNAVQSNIRKSVPASTPFLSRGRKTALDPAISQFLESNEFARFGKSQTGRSLNQQNNNFSNFFNFFGK